MERSLYEIGSDAIVKFWKVNTFPNRYISPVCTLSGLLSVHLMNSFALICNNYCSFHRITRYMCRMTMGDIKGGGETILNNDFERKESQWILVNCVFLL